MFASNQILVPATGTLRIFSGTVYFARSQICFCAPLQKKPVPAFLLNFFRGVSGLIASSLVMVSDIAPLVDGLAHEVLHLVDDAVQLCLERLRRNAGGKQRERCGHHEKKPSHSPIPLFK